MDMQGKKVQSTAFGAGVVTMQGDSSVTVDFNGTEKKFVYPFAFEKFLTAEDAALQKAILTEIETLNAEKARKLRNEQHRANFMLEQQKAEQKKQSERKPAKKK